MFSHPVTTSGMVHLFGCVRTAETVDVTAEMDVVAGVPVTQLASEAAVQSLGRSVPPAAGQESDAPEQPLRKHPRLASWSVRSSDSGDSAGSGGGGASAGVPVAVGLLRNESCPGESDSAAGGDAGAPGLEGVRGGLVVRDIGQHVLERFGSAVFDALCVAVDMPGAATTDGAVVRRAWAIRNALVEAQLPHTASPAPSRTWTPRSFVSAAAARAATRADPDLLDPIAEAS